MFFVLIFSVCILLQKKKMNTPSILKFGGGYSDKIELVVDPNTVIIGNHTGIFKNIDWNTLDYWHLVQCVLKEFVFKLI